jgi:hypothetical protein
VTARGRLLSALWIPLAAVAALALIPPGTTLLSGYALRWYVVGLVLLAVAGNFRLGTGGWAILALLMVAVLAVPAVTHRHAI